ncbi:hypothetical protein IJE86_07865 [bacterium]|nr:hypothetical protein [bacterium]
MNQRVARLKDDTHRYLNNMCKETNASQNDIIKYALVSFKKTKEYAMLVLYNQEPKNIE